MKSEFKIISANGKDFLKIFGQDEPGFPDRWMKMQVNNGEVIEIRCSDLRRALYAIER